MCYLVQALARIVSELYKGNLMTIRSNYKNPTFFCEYEYMEIL